MPQASTTRPLADRIRPVTLDEFIGQKHLVGPGKPIYQAVKQRAIHSMIFWGPPGVGKTTLAHIIANETGHRFVALSAVSASKADVKSVVESVRNPLTPMEQLLHDGSGAASDDSSVGTVLFLDEIHRFNKAQQDFLLPYVEDGTIILIGATTENPSFEVISALLSRSQVFVLDALSEDDLREIIARGATHLGVTVDAEAEDFLIAFANGDGRNTLNLMETVVHLYRDDADSAFVITVDQLRDALQSKHLRYDKADEEHYNTISAFIKSMRASDVDATLYYLARMVAAGEDPKFIARRMVIFASEDIGLAQPTALVVANAVFRAVEVIGYPECQINLAHGASYLAQANKDRSSYEAYFRALDDVNRHGNLPIPLKLRNAPTKLMKDLGYGKDDGDEGLLPDKLRGIRYYGRSQK